MSELFGNPEQVSELSGNPEQLPYTPTTEEVRNSYASWSDAYPEFDRWLESTLQKAQIAERERIISNIYERVSDLRSCTYNDNCVELGELIEEYIPEWTEGENK